MLRELARTHQTIGRDTFWTPAHLAFYLGGVVAGLTCGWLALRVTFASVLLFAVGWREIEKPRATGAVPSL